jgi:staphylococcal nuclease domain-containing protein 1
MEASALKKGTIKGVFSGDLVFLQGKIGKSGLPLEKRLRLIGLTSPSLAHNAEGEDHELGIEAREFLRKILIGKEVEFDIETTINKQEFGRVLLNGKDVAVRVLEEGFAELTTVIDAVKTKPVNLDLYEKARRQAKDAKKGVYYNKISLLGY